MKSSKRSNGSKRHKRPVGAIHESPTSTGAKTTLRVRNAYEAASGGRRLQMWRPGNQGPNAAIVGDLATLRDRSRESLRNNAWMVQGVNNLVSNIIGFGISPEPMSSSKGYNEDAKGLFGEWSKVAHDERILDFYGIQSVSTHELIESGEGIIRLRNRPVTEGLPVPLQLQLLEPEFCPESHNDVIKRIYHGVEFNGVGKRTTYWMYRQHPGDGRGFDSQDLLPVPAYTVLPYYAPLRAGQIRGVPWIVQALIKAKDFDEYDDAELVRKKNRASFTGVFQRPALDETDYLFDPMTGLPVEKDATGVPITNFEAGSFFSALPGEEVKLFDGDTTGAGYAEFSRQQLLGFSAGIGVPYEFLSGDMKDVNDRLMRVILNEYHRRIEQIQWLITIPQICVPVYEAFIDLAVLTGALSAPNYETQRNDYLRCGWNPQRWPYLNPLQDVEAAGKEIQYGLQSRTGAAAERGLVAEEIDRQNAEDKKRSESLGLTYETHTPKAAQPKPGQGNDPNNPAQDDDEEDQQRQYNRVKEFRRLNARHYEGRPST